RVWWLWCEHTIWKAHSRLKGSCDVEKSIICFMVDHPLNIQSHFACMIIAPHTGFSVRDFTSRRNVIPSIGTMIDGMQQQSLMRLAHAQIRLIKDGFYNRKSGLPVMVTLLFLTFLL